MRGPANTAGTDLGTPAEPRVVHLAVTDGFAALSARVARYVDDESLLRLALVHRSYCAEDEGVPSNERLEFLGDAVLGVIVTDRLYERLPSKEEGDLARIRSSIVSSAALAPIASSLGIGEALWLGKGEERSGGRAKPSLLANALEAVIGAAYLSGGLPASQALVDDVLGEQIAIAASTSALGDAKNHLQELAARLGLGIPSYQISEKGPDHAKRFSAEVRLADVIGKGEGRSKKAAERKAAQNAIDAFEEANTGRA